MVTFVVLISYKLFVVALTVLRARLSSSLCGSNTCFYFYAHEMGRS